MKDESMLTHAECKENAQLLYKQMFERFGGEMRSDNALNICGCLLFTVIAQATEGDEDMGRKLLSRMSSNIIECMGSVRDAVKSGEVVL